MGRWEGSRPDVRGRRSVTGWRRWRRRPRRRRRRCARRGPGWRGRCGRRSPRRCGPRTAGVTAGPVTPAAAALRGPVRRRRHVVGIELGRLRDRHRQEHARRRLGCGWPARRPPRRPTRRGRDGQPGGARVERREPVVAPAEHRDAGRLQVLQRASEVEERLRAGAHRDDRVVGDGVEVGGHVAGRARRRGGRRRCRRWRTPRHARRGGQGDGRRHRRGPDVPALGDGDGEIALGRLAGRSEDPPVLAGIQPDASRPSITAVRAGTAPPATMAPRHRSSASALAGDGSPRCEKIVDSSATTGRPAASAAVTSAETTGSIIRRPSTVGGRSG